MDTHSRRRWLKRAWIVLFVGMTGHAAANPAASSRLDFIAQGTLSTPINSFWNRYPQYAAQETPFVRWQLGLKDSDQWRIDAEFDLAQQYVAWRPTNLPLPDSSSYRKFPVEYHGLKRADFLYDFHPLVVALGRNKVHWGATTDSLIVANQVPFLDRLWIHLPMGHWALDELIASPENRTGTNTSVTLTTFQVAHRVSWSRDGWEIGFTEQAMLDRNTYDSSGNVVQKGSYSLTDFLPFSSIHETDVKPFNSMMILDASWTHGKARWAFEGGLDDFDASIFGIPDDPIPSIPAAILEFQWTDERWSTNASLGFTHYLWGNYDGPGYAKAAYRIFLDNGVQVLPLTSPYGPGATWATFQFESRDNDLTWSGKTEVWNVLRGVSLDIPYNDDTPANAWNWFVRAHLFASIKISSFDLTFGPQVLEAWRLWTGQWVLRLSTHMGSQGRDPVS